ncbi:hypothetical protein [Rheinheimera texasensis]|uniref:hypothetical protein n=1 Tax=Rheinheimera texasensis TaxID=306205 RepID=UPI0032B1E50D
MNILFLCTANLNRSKTAELHFAAKDPVNVYKSAGLSQKECRRHGTTLCTEDLLEWADLICVMELLHISRIEQYTGRRFLNKIINLDIPDIYSFGDAALIEQLELSYNAKHHG